MDTYRFAIIAVVAASSLGLALAVYLRNRGSVANRAFAAAVLVSVGWLTLDFLGDQALFRAQAAWLNRLTFASGMLMGALLLYFALVFPHRESRISLPWRVVLAVGAALAAITVFTDLVIKGVQAASWGANLESGPLLPMVAAWAVAAVCGVVYVLARKYRRARGREKAQIKYMLVGVAMFALASIVLGLVLPTATGSYQLARLNALSMLVLVGFTAYAMIKHRLMDIRLVVLRAVVYACLVLATAGLLVAPAVLARVGVGPSSGVASDMLFALVALVAVMAFQPIRHVLERVTDGLFYRLTYDPDELMKRLGASMASTLDMRDLAFVLAEGLIEMRLSFAAAGYRRSDTSEYVIKGTELSSEESRRFNDFWEVSAVTVADDLESGSDLSQALSETGVRVVLPVAGDHEQLGVVLLGAKLSGEMFSAQDVKLLETVAREASIAMKNAHLFDEKQQRVRELSALNDLARSLGSSVELEPLLDAVLEKLVAVTAADSGSIMLLDPATRTLTIVTSIGIPGEIAATTRVPVGQGIAGWAAAHADAVIVTGDGDPRFHNELLRDEIVSAVAAPIVRKDEVIGVINICRVVPSEVFTTENLNVVTSFAGQLAVAIDNARLYTDLENTFLGTITALAATVDAKDPYTFGHSTDVTANSVAVAQRLGLSDTELHNVRVAATLHDIGKIAVDRSVLNKPGKLDDAERALMNEHPAIGADILASLDFLRDAVPLILFHHERYSGGGYPSGISGQAIPLGARIITVADSFNAMISDRPYRKALSMEAAIKELRDNSGTQFDPQVVEAFLEVLGDREQAPVPKRGTLQAVSMESRSA